MVFWSQNAEVVETGSRILISAALYEVFHATRIVYSGALRGAGDTVWLAVASGIGSVGILGVGGALTARMFPSFGALGPWVIATLSIVAVGLAHRWRFRNKRWSGLTCSNAGPW